MSASEAVHYCAAVAVLAELVALKDGPRDADYERRKPVAWDQALAALAACEGGR